MWDEALKRGNRYLELKGLIENPDSAKSPSYPQWLREFGRMSKFGEVFLQFKKAEKEVHEAEAILGEEKGEAEFKALAAEELPLLRQQVESLRASLMEAIEEGRGNEENDRNVIVEVYAGVGGEEAALFVGDLFEMYKHFAESHPAWKLSVLDSSPAEMGGLKDIAFRVEGPGAFGEFKFEGGGHRVQRVPKTEAQGRIHTSMARVAVLPEVEEDVEVAIDPKDVRESFCAAGGPGGQNVNKVATQAQLTHIPTGILVRCTETRSQKQNRERAWQILRSKLYAMKKAEADKTLSDNRLVQLGTGDRSERIRTYNFPQGRCSDHRLEGEEKNWPVQDIMAGKLAPLIAKLKQAQKRQISGGGPSAEP